MASSILKTGQTPSFLSSTKKKKKSNLLQYPISPSSFPEKVLMLLSD
jgi:hypothetical protein